MVIEYPQPGAQRRANTKIKRFTSYFIKIKDDLNSNKDSIKD
jgi:hypothetical protein